MIQSLLELINLIDQADKESRSRLRTEVVPTLLWIKLISLRPDLKRIVTLNKFLDLPVLRILANDSDPDVRCDVANKRNLSSDLFELLARDPDETVKSRIAWNKNTPINILKEISQDSSNAAEVAKERLQWLQRQN